MPELILGGSGRLGSALRARRTVTAPSRGELDLATASDAELGRWVWDASAVLNVAALADVDACEERRAEAHTINAVVPGRLARACRQLGVPLIHVSTDYVFGRGEGPWTEAAEPCPVQAYGESKAAGEAAALAEGGTVVRVSWLFGVDVGPFRRHVLEQAEAGGPVAVFSHQRSRPTSIEAVAAWLFSLADHLGAGGSSPPVLHPVAGPAASRADWARRILKARDYRDIDVVDQGAPSQLAARPEDSRLDGKMTTDWAKSVGLSAMEDWRDAVRRLAAPSP